MINAVITFVSPSMQSSLVTFLSGNRHFHWMVHSHSHVSPNGIFSDQREQVKDLILIRLISSVPNSAE